MMGDANPEPILEPDLAIVDAHHHLWLLTEAALQAAAQRDAFISRKVLPTYRAKPRYLLDEFLADITFGHNVVATIYTDAYAMYRATGPAQMRSVGEVEFANGVAAMAASGVFGEIKVCAAIVGGIDLRLGEKVEEILAAHIRAGNGRYRGVRSPIAYDEDRSILGANVGAPLITSDAKFRAGFKLLHKFDLSFDAWVLEPQLPDLIDLARAFPDTPIIVNHSGGPLAVGRLQGLRNERFPIWRDNIRELAQLPNVAMKLGGLGLPFPDFPSHGASPPFSSASLADEWRPYIETCIDAFGVERCMFESNYPIDAAVGAYATIWNTFKRITIGASPSEKDALYSGTATRTYRVEM